MGREGEGEGEGEGSCDNHLIIIMSEDVLIEILLCLPVISLLRFKSVCKSWRSIIESPFFINLHTTTTNTATNSSFVFFRYEDHCEEEEEEKKRNVFTLSGDKLEVFEDLGRPSVEFEEIEEDWTDRKSFYYGILMVGCCNGIICLHDDFSRCVALWNPAIKQSRILPKPSNLLGGNHKNNLEEEYYSYISDFVGFGIDHVVKTTQLEDYKVLLITSIKPNEEIYDEEDNNRNDKSKLFPYYARSVQVYSLSTDSWKCIDESNLSAAHHPDLLDINTSYQGLHLNGRYFFMGEYYIKKVEEDIITNNNSGLQQAMPLIMSFDFTQEIFTTIELPYDRRNKFNPRSYAALFLFGEKIALNDFSGPYDEFDIWVLNEQQQGGVMEESWTKFYTFGPYEITYSPKCIVDNGEFAIMHGYDQKEDPCQDDQKLQLLNLSTGETKDLQCDCEGLRHVDVYKPSLVPIGGNDPIGTKPHFTLSKWVSSCDAKGRPRESDVFKEHKQSNAPTLRRCGAS